MQNFICTNTPIKGKKQTNNVYADCTTHIENFCKYDAKASWNKLSVEKRES